MHAALKTMCRQVREAEPDLIVLAGDLIEKHPTAQDMTALLGHVRCLSDISPVIIVHGNHDGEGWLALCEGQDTTHDVWVCAVPDTMGLADGRLIHGIDADTECVVHCVPWVTKGHLLSRLPTVPSPEETDAAVRACLQEILGGFAVERQMAGYDGPAVLVGHMELGGSVMDSGQPNVAPGLKIDPHDLELAGCDAYMLGHIHAQQDVGTGVYAGSPYRLTWGEAGPVPKGWLLWDVERGDADFRCVAIHGPRLWAVTHEWTIREVNGDGPEWGFTPDAGTDVETVARMGDGRDRGGDELRFRYRVPAEQRTAAKAAVDACLASFWPGRRDAVTVEEVVIPAERARAPELAAVVDPVEQVRMWMALEYGEWTDQARDRVIELARQALHEVE